MDGAITAVCALGGLFIGDGLEVVVERTGDRAALDRPWWRCGSCGTPATGLGLVPLARSLSRARGCGTCGAPIAHAWRPLALAALTAAVLAGFGWRLGAQPALAAYAVFGTGLVAISAVDLEHYRIPNRLLYPTLLSTASLLVVASAVDDLWGSAARAAIAGVVAFGGFFVVHLIVPHGMGFGDVRLAGLIGVGTGWLGLGHCFVAFMAAFLLGAVIGIVVMVVTGGGRKTKIPFGPFLAAGAVIAVVWGGPLVTTFLHRPS